MPEAKQDSYMENPTEKHTVTFSEETVEWLKEQYPDALSVQEAVRTAIADARLHKSVVQKYDDLPDQK